MKKPQLVSDPKEKSYARMQEVKLLTTSKQRHQQEQPNRRHRP